MEQPPSFSSTEPPEHAVEPSPEVAPPEPARRRGRVWLAVLAGLAAVALIVGVTFFAGPKAIALSYDWEAGETLTFAMDVEMSMKMGAAPEGQVHMTAVEELHVDSVDEEGTATVSISMNDVETTANGQPVEAPIPDIPPMRITADGTTIGASGTTLFSGEAGGSGNQPALLPAYPVIPGDTWSKDQATTIFGAEIILPTVSTFLRTERLGDAEAAVIQSMTEETPVTWTVDLGTAGGDLGMPSGEVPAGTMASYDGTMSRDVTTWVDVDAKQFLKVSGQVDAEYSVSLTDPDGADLGTVPMVMSMDMTMEQL